MTAKAKMKPGSGYARRGTILLDQPYFPTREDQARLRSLERDWKIAAPGKITP